MISRLNDEHSVRFLCEALDVHRGALYHQPRPTEDRPLRDALRGSAGQWPTYGQRRLAVRLHRQGHGANTRRVRRLVHEMGPCGSAPARRPRATDSDHASPRHLNLVEGLEVVRPDQVRVADITSVGLKEEFVCLSVVMGVFTRWIRGWHLGRSPEQERTTTALNRAFAVGRPEVHHCDQGVQYAATACVEMPRAAGSQISVASVGEPRGNGYAERLMRTIEEEGVALSECEELAEAWRQLGRSLDDGYDRERIHSALGHLTPSESEQRWIVM